MSLKKTIIYFSVCKVTYIFLYMQVFIELFYKKKINKALKKGFIRNKKPI